MFHLNPGPSGVRRPCSFGVQQDVGPGQQAEERRFPILSAGGQSRSS
jgi:hypothetical protein